MGGYLRCISPKIYVPLAAKLYVEMIGSENIRVVWKWYRPPLSPAGEKFRYFFCFCSSLFWTTKLYWQFRKKAEFRNGLYRATPC